MESEKYLEISYEGWFKQIDTLQRKVTAIFTTAHHAWPVRVCQVKANSLEVGLALVWPIEMDIEAALSFDYSLQGAIKVVRKFNKAFEGYRLEQWKEEKK